MRNNPTAMHGTIFLLAGLLLVAGCAGPPPATAGDLAEALRDEGIAYTSSESLPVPSGKYFRFDEGLALNGDGLRVEIMRIDDPKVYDIAKSAGGLIRLAEASAGQAIPEAPEVYARQPFLVVMRQEPTPKIVLHALNEVMPAEE